MSEAMIEENSFGMEDAALFISNLGQAEAHLQGAIRALGRSALHESEMMNQLECIAVDLSVYMGCLQPIMLFQHHATVIGAAGGVAADQGDE